MRNMSFALTTDQVKAETKDVTRRLGWRTLKPGELFCAVVKGQGLKKGEKIQRLKILRAVDVRPEPLRRMTDDLDYGLAECRREGFPEPSPKSFPSEFVRFFCASHPPCTPDTVITRIEFQYVYTMVTKDAPMAIPKDIAVCPYCEATLTGTVSGWTQSKDGLWETECLDLDCGTSPDIDSDLFDEWVNRHSEMPYEHMLPVERKVLRWLNSIYRWE